MHPTDDSCADTKARLVDFHFGAITAADRDRLQEVLSSCPDCLRTYFRIKADIELSAADPVPPSDLLHARVRRSAAAFLPDSRPGPTRGQRIATLGVAVSLLLAAWLTSGAVALSDGRRPVSAVDKAPAGEVAPVGASGE